MHKKALFVLIISIFYIQLAYPLFKTIVLVGTGALAVTAYYKQEEIKTYAYGAYLKYWRLPYLKEDILESLRTGKQLSDYSKETIKLALKKSPDFLALWLKEKLTPEQAAQVVALFNQFLNPQELMALTQNVWHATVNRLKEKAQKTVDKAKQKIQKKWNELLFA